MGKSFPGIAQSNAEAWIGFPSVAWPVVADQELQARADALRGGFDKALVFALGDSVANRIFYDGLKKKTGNQSVESRGIQIDINSETVREAQTFDRKIAFDDLEFLSKWDFPRSASLEA